MFLPLWLLAVPNAPLNLSLSPTAHDVTVAWSDDSDDETGFKVFRDGVLIQQTAANVTSYTDTGLLPNTSYTYTVKATDDVEWIFDSVAIPWRDADQKTVLSTAKVTLADTSYDLKYHTIIRSGDSIGNRTYGLIKDKYNNAIVNADGSLKQSNIVDFTSILPVGDKLFMISNFETTPSGMYISELEQNATTGELTAISTKNIDVSAFNGVMETCAGSVTPWNTHLAGEEVMTSARWMSDDGHVDWQYDKIADYDHGDIAKFNPYYYGYMVEVSVLNTQGDVNVSKHYSMGRFSHELGYVMPDKKTVYLSNDNINGVLYKFVADTPEDLSSGILYAAKWHQISGANGGSANITWVSLGHATDAQIAAAIADKTIKFSDMLESGYRDANNSCSAGFLATNWNAENTCLKAKPGMSTIASRLETGRYAGMMGATTEFSYTEGLAYNKQNNELYISMSTVKYGMEDNKYKNVPDTKWDKGGTNDIRLDKANRCGIVYKLILDANYSGVKMEAFLRGKEEGTWSCTDDHIATPDNIFYMPESKSLLIAEDSFRDNNMLWTYNINTKNLTRIQTAPYGAEITSVQYYPDINGFGYLMSIIQHPFEKGYASEMDKPEDAKAYTGYIGPFKLP